MYVYAEDSHVIFECENCGAKHQVPAVKTREFQRCFAAFKLLHDVRCLQIAEKITAPILEKLQAGQ